MDNTKCDILSADPFKIRDLESRNRDLRNDAPRLNMTSVMDGENKKGTQGGHKGDIEFGL
jgi:hypothetical protein